MTGVPASNAIQTNLRVPDMLLFSPHMSISCYRKIIEVRDAVGLCPEAGSAGFREGPIFCFKDLRSVEKHADLRVLENDTKIVPLALGDVILNPYARDGIPFEAIERRTPFSTLYSTMLFSNALARTM
jgi:hypothetical protein